MDKLKPREKLLLAVLIIIGILYVYIKLLYVPLKEQIKETMASIVQKKVEYQTLKNMEQENRALNTQIQGLKSVYLASMNLLPQSEKNPEIYYNINKLALNSKVAVSAVNVGSATEAKGNGNANAQNQNNAKAQTSGTNVKWKFISVPVSFTATGDYKSVIQLVHDLENDTRQCQILSVNLASSNDGKTKGIQANITMEYFYMDQGTYDLQYDFNKGTYGKDTLFN